MPSYRAKWRYRSSIAAFDKDAILEISAAEAEAINRDSPGVLVEQKPPRKGGDK